MISSLGRAGNAFLDLIEKIAIVLFSVILYGGYLAVIPAGIGLILFQILNSNGVERSIAVALGIIVFLIGYVLMLRDFWKHRNDPFD